MLESQFPAVASIKFSQPGDPQHYTLGAMIIWVTLPYAIWQLSYHFLITVRKRSKIAAGNPTSFTFLRKSYAKNPLGKFVLSCPDSLQEPVFMCIQYIYALLTMVPCPIWFWYRWASSAFMMVVFAWASWNGATYYIDVFGRRMEKELNALRTTEALTQPPLHWILDRLRARISMERWIRVTSPQAKVAQRLRLKGKQSVEKM
jgi:hypothetical protein